MSKVRAAASEIAKPRKQDHNWPMERPAGSRKSVLARGWIVRVAVALSILLVMAMMAFLWHRWLTVREPTTAIVVNGDPTLKGAKIIVESRDDTAEQKVEVTLGEERQYRAAIFRYPGHYRVLVQFPGKKEATPIEDVVVYRLRGAQIDLPTTLAINGQPGDKVILTNSDGGGSQTLTLEGPAYSASILLPPGNYT